MKFDILRCKLHRFKMNIVKCFVLLYVLLCCKVIDGQEETNVGPSTEPPVLLGVPKPSPREWIKGVYPANKTDFLKWFINGCTITASSCSVPQYQHVEYEGFDGWYNNLVHPELGAIDTALIRRLPARYEDGTYQPIVKNRPNPLNISEMLMKGKIGTQSKTGKTALLLFFGQQVVEEILDAQGAACPPEYFNIPIPKDHPYRKETGHSVLPLLRTRYDFRTGYSPNNPRQQLNEITPWFDGGLTYGTSKAWCDTLRTNPVTGRIAPNGELASSHGGLFPAYNDVKLPMANPPPPVNHTVFTKRKHRILPVSRFFMLGNPRGNENAFLLVFGVMWFRWHNHLAKFFKKTHHDWSGEEIFQEARKWTIATHQSITMYHWLPAWLGEGLPAYKGYNPSIDPQIEQMFQSAAMRFGHTLVTPGVYIRDFGRNGCKTIPYTIDRAQQHSVGIRTCNIFWNSQLPLLAKPPDSTQLTDVIDIDRLLMGMSLQLTEREDNIIVEDLRGRVFGPLEFQRRDLMAINLQRARDHGLPDYNSARESYGLPRVNTFDNFKNITNSDVADEVIKAMTSQYLYGSSTDNIDLWAGGLLETNAGPGQIFRAIIADQFQRIRDGDRFWFENTRNGHFTEEEVQRIKEITIYDIILSVTNMEENDIQQNPFQAPKSRNDLHVNCSLQVKNSSCFRRIVNGTSETRGENISCFHLPQLGSTDVPLEMCTRPGTYDYFIGSEIPFMLSFLFIGLTVAGCILLSLFLSWKKQRIAAMEGEKLKSRLKAPFMKIHHDEQIIPYAAFEWVGKKEGYRPVVLLLLKQKRKLEVRTQMGNLLRIVDVVPNAGKTDTIDLVIVNDDLHLMVRVPMEYDLMLKFDSAFLREPFLKALEELIETCGARRQRLIMGVAAALSHAVSLYDRRKKLEKFFRVVFAQAFNISHNEKEMLDFDSVAAKDVIYTELTKNEFADTLAMNPDSIFVDKMFKLVDKDHNNYISFREFLDMLVIFSKGTANEKAKLMFEMYDINRTGTLSQEDFKGMIRSMMEASNVDIEPQQVDKVVASMFQSLGASDKRYVTLDDFQRLMNDYKDTIGYSELHFSGTNIPSGVGKHIKKKGFRGSLVDNARDTFFGIYDTKAGVLEKEPLPLPLHHSHPPLPEPHVETKQVKPAYEFGHLKEIKRIVQNYRLHIFWATLYTLVLLAIFTERAYYYSVEREHSGIRRIAGYGVTVTRGAASAMMFTYSTLLVTMCRNLITFLRETFLHRFMPFDASVIMHKYVALWALFFSGIHTIGHGINFYHISTQTSSDLACLFRNYFNPSHHIPKFQFWCWGTLTGFTGVLLVLICGIMFTFSTQYSRTHLHNWFWYTHNLYPIFYVLIILHGAGRLIQEPFFHYFFLGPCLLFTVDRLISISRKKVEIPVIKAELLPSNVTYVSFKRPANFEYKSGQWVRIACKNLNSREFHPFTLSTAPHEQALSVHVRAVGPWTHNFRKMYDGSVIRDGPLPKLHLDGPYGEGHQDWYKFEVSVLVGGGIGVTPFSSILKDIVFKSSNKFAFGCKKVYFLWVTRTQKHFEWLVDIIREVEDNDKSKVVSTHIFITQFYHKFDLRTVMLYICERHFQKVSNRSLFTGLRSVTHFGRPNFTTLFSSLKMVHPEATRIGVFSCGPPPMTRNVDEACNEMNRKPGTIFQHHSENF